MSVNSKSTKAEILAAYRALAAEPTTLADVMAWAQHKTRSAARELGLMVKDCYELGCQARMVYDGVVGELSRPILK
ncbi:MAG: hypothetical protein ACO20M_06055 [Methylophilaceae bacterium]